MSEAYEILQCDHKSLETLGVTCASLCDVMKGIRFDALHPGSFGGVATALTGELSPKSAALRISLTDSLDPRRRRPDPATVFMQIVAAGAPDQAMEHIFKLFDGATGNKGDAAKVYLRDVVEIVERGLAPPDWHERLEAKYPLELFKLLVECFRFDTDGKYREPEYWPLLTEEQRKKVVEHLPLVEKLATKLVGKVRYVGKEVHEPALRAELADLGLLVMEEVAPKWDRTRGAFGTFVRPYLEGRMRNWLKRDRKPGMFPSYDEASHHSSVKNGKDWNGAAAHARERWKAEANTKRVKADRTSTGALKNTEKPYIETETKAAWDNRSKKVTDGVVQSPEGAAEIEQVLARLPDEEQAVYRGRVLANPKVSLRVLAKQLNVKHPRIVAMVNRLIPLVDELRKELKEGSKEGTRVGLTPREWLGYYPGTRKHPPFSRTPRPSPDFMVSR